MLEVRFPYFFNHYMPGLLLIKPWDSSDFHSAVWESYQQKQGQTFFKTVFEIKIAPSARGECTVIEPRELKTKLKNTYKCVLAD